MKSQPRETFNPPGGKGVVPKWCKRCGGRHAGGVTRCKLILLYLAPGLMPHYARQDVADLVEDYLERT